MHRTGVFFTEKGLTGGCLRARNTPGLLMLFLLVLLGIVSCSNESSPPNNASGPQRSGDGEGGTIVAVGDSLTAGYGVDETEAYPALLEKRLLSDGYPFKVVNAGVSGETSSGTRSRIEWVIRSLHPDIVILETGANDGLRGVDPGVLEKNLDEIVTTLQANGIAILLAGMKMPPNLGPAYTGRFADVYPTIAARHRIPLIPFFLKSVAGDARYNLPDRLHPNPEGYRRILNDIYPYILETIKGQ